MTNAFGPDSVESALSSVAATVRALNAERLVPAQHDDVLIMFEWMQQELVTQHDNLLAGRQSLDERETAHAAAVSDLEERERQLAIRLRAVNLSGKMAPKRKARRWLTIFSTRSRGR